MIKLTPSPKAFSTKPGTAIKHTTETTKYKANITRDKETFQSFKKAIPSGILASSILSLGSPTKAANLAATQYKTDPV